MSAMAMNPQHSRRAAAALLVGAALGALAVIVLPFYLLNRHYDAALADLGDKLDRYRRVAGSRAAATQQLEAMRALEPRKGFLRSGAPALSAAEASEALRTIIEANGGKLITIQAPVARDEGRYRQFTVNVQLSGTIFAVRKILHAIETNQPALFVESLQLRTTLPANFKPNPGQEPDVFMVLDVSGYTIAGGA
jgi:general secretion pathway protein M